jgi:hypothetical protein
LQRSKLQSFHLPLSRRGKEPVHAGKRVHGPARHDVVDADAQIARHVDITHTKGTDMKSTSMLLAVCLAGLSAGAYAQSVQEIQQRDVSQQQRIESGLQSGQLNTREAAALERDQKKLQATEARDLKNGKLSTAERQQLNTLENKTSRDIHEAKTNGVKGDPLSTSSQRMQADVQRNVNEDKRIDAGVKNGSLTNHEVAKLDRGQARVDGKEARAGQSGFVNKNEQRGVQHAENTQSRKIHRLKTNGAVRKG